jgi:hypothetical protein
MLLACTDPQGMPITYIMNFKPRQSELGWPSYGQLRAVMGNIFKLLRTDKNRLAPEVFKNRQEEQSST